MKIDGEFNAREGFHEIAAAAPEALFELFGASAKGLTEEEARVRLEKYGHNQPAKKRKRTILAQIGEKCVNPLVVVLLIISGFSLFFGERISAVLISLMAGMSVFLSFIQEYRAGREAEKLREMVRATATVYRNGRPREIKIRDLVPGDVADLFAGDMIPADMRIFSCKDLFINQASLTGESFPLEKFAEAAPAKGTSLSEWRNIVFMGSSVVSGTGLGLVVKTGINTQFGEISRRLANQRVESGFDKGIKRFTWLMIRFMLALVAVIFLVNWMFKGNPIQALLFSLAVAVGMTPEMLPMIVAINFSKGAGVLAQKQVIVKRLNAIQDFGAMDVLCTDKTGTITMDKIVLEKHCDVIRREDRDVLRYAYINSYYQTGLKNLLDKAILKHEKLLVKQYKKFDEIPFDFSRRVMSVVVESEGDHLLITKGAPEEIFKRCASYELDGEILELENLIVADLREEFASLSAEGYRVLAVAYRSLKENKKPVYGKDDESELILKGYMAFLDPPKASVRKTIQSLKNYGIELKVLTGDNELVTKKICGDVGLDVRSIVTGNKVEELDDAGLRELVKTTNIFARLSPLQKERVILALRANGRVVGYLGDGINDAAALKASDVGISVNNAVDIAKESADIILIQKSLTVLVDGVVEGRKTFGNIIKYIKMGASSNLGNMISMTGASILLPFLPMTPVQILLNNFLYDLSQAAIPTDEVDKEYIMRPRVWNVGAIGKFMMFIGPVSSLFDFVTFGVLYFLFRAPERLFHTGWFMESLCTQALVIHVIRTAKTPFLESKPSLFLVITSVLIAVVGLVLPFSPLAGAFGFVKPPAPFFVALFFIVLFYLFLVQKVKTWFIKRHGTD